MSSGAPTSIIDMQDASFDTSLYYSFGFPNAKRNNIHLIESNVVVLSVGNTLQFFNLRSRTYHWIEVQGQDGIGAIAVCYCFWYCCNITSLRSGLPLLIQQRFIQTRSLLQ